MSFRASVEIPRRRHFLGTALLILLGSGHTAWADLVVVSNRSVARGNTAVYVGTEQFSSSFISPIGPTTGTFIWSGTTTSSDLGATATVWSDVTTSISSSGISGNGSTTAVSTQQGTATASTLGTAGAQLNFTLASPQMFSYAATFVLESEGTHPLLSLHAVAGLSLVGANGQEEQSVFFDQLARLSQRPAPGTYTLTRSGLLLPGLYVLSGGLASMFQATAADNPYSRGRIAWNFAFDVTPASNPVPEPATLTLLGTALAGVAMRPRVRRRTRQGGSVIRRLRSAFEEGP